MLVCGFVGICTYVGGGNYYAVPPHPHQHPLILIPTHSTAHSPTHPHHHLPRLKTSHSHVPGYLSAINLTNSPHAFCATLPTIHKPTDFFENNSGWHLSLSLGNVSTQFSSVSLEALRVVFLRPLFARLQCLHRLYFENDFRNVFAGCISRMISASQLICMDSMVLTTLQQ